MLLVLDRGQAGDFLEDAMEVGTGAETYQQVYFFTDGFIKFTVCMTAV